MYKRLWTLVVLVMLLACSPAFAAPATVNVRVESVNSTIFEGPVTTDAKSIDKGDGPHKCDGTNGGANPSPGPTMFSALDDAARLGGFGWAAHWDDGYQDFFLDGIGPILPAGNYWGYALNYEVINIGGCQQRVQPGDDVLFAVNMFGGPPDYAPKPFLRLSGPVKAKVGTSVTVSVSDGVGPAAGAAITGAPGTPVTAADGTAGVSFASEGIKRLKADRSDAIRSNALSICVSKTGSGDCGVLAAPGSGTAPGTPVRDSVAPTALISAPRNGAALRRGPRVLRGTAHDAQTSVTVVKIALRRHVHGRNCRWWSGRRERFVGSNCRKRFFFAIGSNENWSYLLPRRLPVGHYVLDVKAFDRARNRDERFVRGQNRVVFDVLGARKRRVKAARARRRNPRVQAMVVGRSATLVPARSVRSRPRLVRASGRRCLVAAATPLAALAATLASAEVRYHVRDFGRCSARRSSSSGQLFVDRIGGDRNEGDDGWFYKVNDRAGTAGAADPGGRRLRRGDRVLWFYCRFDASADSCQRSLEIRPATRSVAARDVLRVRVLGHRNDGQGEPIAGAEVRLGPTSALTDSSGRARLVAPFRGLFLLQAEKTGTVPAFPVRVRVTGGANSR